MLGEIGAHLVRIVGGGQVLAVAVERRHERALVLLLRRAHQAEHKRLRRLRGTSARLALKQLLEAHLRLDRLVVEQVLHVDERVDLLVRVGRVVGEQTLPEELDLLERGARVTVEALVVAGQRLLGAAHHVHAECARDHLVLRTDDQVGHVVVEIGGLLTLDAEARVRFEVLEHVAEVDEADQVLEVGLQVADEVRPHGRVLLAQLHVVALGLELGEEVRLDRVEVEHRRRCLHCHRFFFLIVDDVLIIALVALFAVLVGVGEAVLFKSVLVKRLQGAQGSHHQVLREADFQELVQHTQLGVGHSGSQVSASFFARRFACRRSFGILL